MTNRIIFYFFVVMGVVLVSLGASQVGLFNIMYSPSAVWGMLSLLYSLHLADYQSKKKNEIRPYPKG